MNAASGLDGLLGPLSRCLDAESARRVVDLKVELPVQERIDTLAERIGGARGPAYVVAPLIPTLPVRPFIGRA